MSDRALPKVIIIGGGFGGLSAARTLARQSVQITLIDRKNHHTFQPLLYEVATAGLSPGEIAAPIRHILHRYKNVEVILGDVSGFDLDRRRVRMDGMELDYDYLVVAAGATHSYFNHPEWERLAPGLKTIEDALDIRRRVLLAFEEAERQAVTRGKHEPLNFIVVGGGPTGVELAGTLAEIARHSLAHDFRSIDPQNTRVLLIEAGARVLPAFPEDLSRSAEKQLRHLGVDVLDKTVVTAIEPGQVKVGDRVFPSTVTLWAAGVAASPLGKMLGVPLDKPGRVIVNQDLSVPGHPEIFVVGDLANFTPKGEKNPLPGLAPVAMQQGRHAAKNIAHEVNRQPRSDFHYHDKGTMATIGRGAAIAQIGKLHLSGFIAWLMWLFVHLMYLVGFRNRILVLTEWAWAYFTYQRSARLITGSNQLPGWMQQQGLPPSNQPSVEELHDQTAKSAD